MCGVCHDEKGKRDVGSEKQRGRQKITVRNQNPVLDNNPIGYGECSLQVPVEVLKKMIKFSWKFIQKLLQAGKEFDEFQHLIYGKEEKIIVYNARSEEYVDVRSTLTTTPQQDKELFEAFYMFQAAHPDNVPLTVATYVNRVLTYATDQQSFNVPEYWKSPYDTWKTRRGDCDDYALLILKVWQLLGVPSSRRLIWCGDIFNKLGEYAGGHAVPIYLSYETNEWYPVEGSYFAEETNDKFNSVPLWENKLYGKSWFCFNEVKSFAGTRFGGGK